MNGHGTHWTPAKLSIRDSCNLARRWWAAPCLATGIALVALVLSGCSRRGAEATEPSVSFSAGSPAKSEATLFTVPAEQMSHLQIVPAQSTTFPRVLRLTGSVAFNSFETTPVITQVSGPVARILMSPGQVVQRDQPLLFVASPDYSQLRSNYLKARDAYQLADKNYARARDLYAHHAIAEADLLQAESTRNQADADRQAAEQALKVLGVTHLDRLLQDAPSPEIPVLAPIAGEIVERLVAPGQVIQAGATQVFTISNLRSVWVLANVYQHDLGEIHLGDSVSIQTDAYPTTFHGRISYIAAALDPTTRTLQVRIVTDNPGEMLKKDMYVTATVNAGSIKNVLAVPAAAVLRDNENQPFVYTVAGPGQFARRPVTLGDTQDGQTQILSGLKAGEQVVGDGSLFLQFANSYQR